MRINIILLAIVFIGSSCSSNRPLSWKLGKNSGIARMPQFTSASGAGGLFWATYDATRRSSLININNGRMSVLGEVQPDAATELSRSLSGALKGKAGEKVDVDASLSLSAIQSIATLGQRTVAVNMQRDALYRLSELSINDSSLNAAQIDSLYKFAVEKFTNVAIKEAEAQENRDSLDIMKTELAILKAKSQLLDSTKKIITATSLSQGKKDSLIIDIVNRVTK